MTFIIGLFITVGILLLGLSIALVVVYIRLSRELRRVGDTAHMTTVKLGRAVRLLQVAIPVAVAARARTRGVYAKIRSIVKKEKL